MHDDSKPSRTVPLLDLRAQFASIEAEIWPVIQDVVTSQKFILGEEVTAFEKQVADYCRCKYAIGCASGSDALLLALMAYDIGPGDRVLTTPYTFFATTAAITRLGAIPVFVDIEPDHFNMDPDQAVTIIETARIKAVIPVHLFGACVDLDPILTAARERGIPVIEDAAQSIGSEYKGRRAGSIGEIGCFSFFPSKNLGAFGDAGLCTTNDASIADRLRSLRVHGSRVKYYHEVVGINSRLDVLQAAVLRVKLRHLDKWSAARQRNADIYRELLSSSVMLPRAASYQTRHIYNQFVIQCQHRTGLRDYLQQNGVGTEIYYPLPLHLQPCFAYLGYKTGDFPVSEKLAKTSLALPIYPELEPADIEYVAHHIDVFFGAPS
ncbi:MAG TPA: DegT/DnrJ/EryC1/StrS family aminotransferase [Bryobacteraceae bacterium]|nr:DegT/DnrJ/EryC1/StrS family aminotransferase [Bryobacteraceae bacterium]